MATSDRYASILNTVLEIAKERGQDAPEMSASMLAYELIEAALSEAEVWGVSPEEIGLAGFDPNVLLRAQVKSAA
jgi:hypothetical protein